MKKEQEALKKQIALVFKDQLLADHMQKLENEKQTLEQDIKETENAL